MKKLFCVLSIIVLCVSCSIGYADTVSEMAEKYRKEQEAMQKEETIPFYPLGTETYKPDIDWLASETNRISLSALLTADLSIVGYSEPSLGLTKYSSFVGMSTENIYILAGMYDNHTFEVFYAPNDHSAVYHITPTTFSPKEIEERQRKLMSSTCSVYFENNLETIQALADALDAVISSKDWVCPNCGKKDNNTNFCPNCGTKKPDDNNKTADSKQQNMPESQITAKPVKTPEPKPRYRVGEYVYFGKYEQDREGNHPDKIQWLVIDIDGDSLFLLSKKCLEAKPFNSRSNGVTWKDCDLRKWLNNDFLYSAFTDNERKAIKTTSVKNDSSQTNRNWNTVNRLDGVTSDKVFLLSYREALDLLVSSQRMCTPSNKIYDAVYIESQNGERCCNYWLRTCAYANNAGVVIPDGTIETAYIHYAYAGVRPALWVDATAVYQ